MINWGGNSMSQHYLIGIDVGTQGTKAALFSSDGVCLAENFQKSNLLKPAPGVVEEDPEEQLLAVCKAIKGCLELLNGDPSDVAALALDGQMAGIIGVDDHGINITPYDSWLDTRCAPYIQKMEETAGDEIIRLNGGPASFNHGPKKLWWKHERPEIYKNIRAFVQPSGYVAMRLCGLRGDEAFIDPSYLHFSGFADNRNNLWDEGLCNEFGLDRDKLPRIVQCSEQVGTIIEDMAQQCGLSAGIPVIAGCGDTIASFLSCGGVRPGICIDVAGTASVFACTTDACTPDTLNQTLAFAQSAIPGLWYAYAYINGGGMNLEWFKKEVMSLAHRSEDTSVLDWDDLNDLAAQIEPKGHSPMFVPHLGGRNSPAQPELRGAWVNLDWTDSIGTLYRSMLEGVALEYRLYLNTCKKLVSDFNATTVRATGGGAMSNLWNQIKSDTLDVPVTRVNRSEGAPLGVAMIAGYGVGLFDDLTNAADQWLSVGNQTYPNPEMRTYYDIRTEQYERLITALHRWHIGND